MHVKLSVGKIYEKLNTTSVSTIIIYMVIEMGHSNQVITSEKGL